MRPLLDYISDLWEAIPGILGAPGGWHAPQPPSEAIGDDT